MSTQLHAPCRVQDRRMRGRWGNTVFRCFMTALFGQALVLGGCVPPAARIPGNLSSYPSGLACIAADGTVEVVALDSPSPIAIYHHHHFGTDEISAAASPTGAHIALVVGERDLFVVPTLLGQAGVLHEGPVSTAFWPHVSPWAPDGRSLVIVSDNALVLQPLHVNSRIQKARNLFQSDEVHTAAFSPSGEYIAFGRRAADGMDRGLWLAATHGRADPWPVVSPTDDIFTACCPHWSPDSEQIAFMHAYEGGALGVVDVEDVEAVTAIEAAWEPIRWLPDSSAVLYPAIPYGGPYDGLWEYSPQTHTSRRVAFADRLVTFALSPGGMEALVASRPAVPDDVHVPDWQIAVVTIESGAVNEIQEVAAQQVEVYWSNCGEFLALWTRSDGASRLFMARRTVPQGALVEIAGVHPAAVAGWVRYRP